MNGILLINKSSKKPLEYHSQFNSLPDPRFIYNILIKISSKHPLHYDIKPNSIINVIILQKFKEQENDNIIT
jgi:hypothetical protein